MGGTAVVEDLPDDDGGEDQTWQNGNEHIEIRLLDRSVECTGDKDDLHGDPFQKADITDILGLTNLFELIEHELAHKHNGSEKIEVIHDVPP